jgi:hypothetical protein
MCVTCSHHRRIERKVRGIREYGCCNEIDPSNAEKKNNMMSDHLTVVDSYNHS